MTQPITITQQRKFTNASDYDAFSVVRLGNGCVASLGGRNTWIRIDSEAGCSDYRMIRGVGSVTGFPADAIEIDYGTSMSLGIPKGAANVLGFYPCSLTVRPATRWEILRAHWNHPDHGYRFPLQISLIGLFLGIVGLVLGVLSLT